jgi:serine phosphatase RsbU (regulator of sigma subunit)
MADILDPRYYELHWLSLPYFLAMIGILIMALYALVVSGEQLLRASFLTVCAGLLPMAACYALVGSTTDPRVASSLYKFGLALVPTAAAGAFAFESVLAQQLNRNGWLIFIAMATSLVQAVPVLTTDLYVDGVWRTPSGLFHFAAGPFLPVSLASLALWIGLTTRLVYKRLDTEQAPARRRQLRDTMIAFLVFCLSAVDVLLAYGIGLYPLSWLFFLLGAGLLFRSFMHWGLIRHATLDSRAPLIVLYLGAAAVGLFLVWRVAGNISLLFLSFLSLGVYLVLRVSIALITVLRDPRSILSDTPLERVIEQYSERVQASHSEQEIAEITTDAVALGLGCRQVKLIMQIPNSLDWETADHQPLSERANPLLTLNWFLDHDTMLQRFDLPALSLGDFRDPVDELFDAHDAEILVPLVNRDELVGMLLLGELPQGHALSRGEQRFLDSVKEHLTAALVYARMHREANTRVAMQKEVELAAAIQRAFVAEADLLECGSVQVSGLWAPATQCGGDWWSVHTLPDGRVLILIGDVTGHGVAAAMVTAAAKGCYDVVQRLRGNDLDLTQLLHHLDTTVRTVGDNRFHMTCFASLLDPEGGTVTYANAGHLAPYICRTGPEGVELGALVARGNPLGASEEPHHTRVRELDSGDVIVWYTDGIVECANSESEQFGERRMQRLLRKIDRLEQNARSARDYIIREVAAFQGGEPPDDDITLVVARIK